MTNAFASLTRSDTLAEFNLQVLPLETNPQSQAWAQSMLGPHDLWFVIDTNGHLVTKGRVLPTSKDLNQKLLQSGVTSAERYLKQFLKLHPHNHEARTELINLTHTNAINQTIKTLGIVPEIKEREIKATATMWSGDANLKPVSKTKTLDADSDLKIWALFAQELENLFSDSSWMAAPLAINGYLAEIHSPMMQSLYKRHLNKIQDALVMMPSNYQFWQLWARFKSATPEKPLINFLNELKPLPQELKKRNYFLEPRIVNLLIEDARKYEEWTFVRELLWSHFNIEFPQQKPQQIAKANIQMELVYRADSVDIYQNFIEPLIETLVQSNQEKLVLDVIYRFKNHRGDIQELNTRLSALASRLNRTDLLPSWISQ
jgi:hypothetical protein